MLFLFLLAFSAQAQGPAWWITRGVLDQNLAPQDYAPINQGQLKWLASNAYVEVSQTIGPSADLTARINAFSPSNNYFPVNIGQVKYLAAPFYDRLYEFGLTNTMPPGMTGYYPWDGRPETNDYAMVNIGQAKYVFSFDLSVDSDNDGLPDWWEVIHGTDPYNPDTDGDGLSDGWEVAHGTNPLDWDTDGDGLSDGWEVAHGYDPLDENDVNEALVREAARQKIIQHWILFNSWRFEFTNAPGSAADLIDMKWALNLLSCKFYTVEFTYETLYYHLNRAFTPVEIDIEGTPTVYQLNSEADKLTDIVKGLALQFDTNNTYAIERNAAAICYTTATGAWDTAVNYNGTPSNYPVKIYDNCGWVRGTIPTNDEWGAYFWTLQNHLAFRTSESNWWRHTSPTGSFVEITNVFVGSIGNFPPGTNEDDIGPSLFVATNFPGADCGEVKEYKVDITNIFYQVAIPDIWITPREAKASVNGTNIQFTVTGTNIPQGVTWKIIPEGITSGAVIQASNDWHYAGVTPGTLATNYKVRATSVNNTNFYDEAVLKVFKMDIAETNIYVAVSNTTTLHLTSDSSTNVQWEITQNIQSGAVIQGSSTGTNVVINAGSIPTNYMVKAYAPDFSNCYDTCSVIVIKVEKIPLGGTNNLSQCIMGKVYVPTKWGGNLKLLGGSVNLYYTDGTNLDDNTAIQIFKGELEANHIAQGNPCEYTASTNQFKWFYVKSSSSAPTAITVNFEQSKTVTNSPWDCPWYPMSDEQSPNLYDSGGCLNKYDTAFSTSSTNQERISGWQNDDGHYVAMNTLKESDAERTWGYDMDNADSDTNVWTGWETNFPCDFWNSAITNWGTDGDTNDEYDASWWGHCDMATAAIICENEPTGDYTTNGVIFTPELKKGLLVALYHQYETLCDSGPEVFPHDWQKILEERLIGSNTMVGCDVYYPDPGNTTNQVWNYPIYEITKAEYMEKTNQTDETTVEIKCELKYWKSTTSSACSLYYRYNVVYDNNGIAFSSVTNDWLEHPLAPANEKRPDIIWMPKAKTSVDAFWGGQLNYSIIRNIVPGL